MHSLAGRGTALGAENPSLCGGECSCQLYRRADCLWQSSGSVGQAESYRLRKVDLLHSLYAHVLQRIGRDDRPAQACGYQSQDRCELIAFVGYAGRDASCFAELEDALGESWRSTRDVGFVAELDDA
jgi:hypothetical protein